MSFIQRYGRCIYALVTPEPTNYLVELTISPSELGTISGGGTYEKGASVTITATPNTGYTFEGWYDGDILVSSETEYTFTINDSLNLSAVFILDPYNGLEYVDLGLPSGTLWADRNVGATAPEDYGSYFSWGNIEGHKSSNGSTFDDGYDWGTSNSGPYASTPGKSVSANIQSNDSAHDAALANLGGSWHMPTKEQFQELYDNTDNEWTSINGVNGRKFMKKSDHSVYVFFPAAGYGDGTSLSRRGSRGFYWSSSWYSADGGYRLYFNSSSVNPQDYSSRCYGYSVRAVIG